RTELLDGAERVDRDELLLGDDDEPRPRIDGEPGAEPARREARPQLLAAALRALGRRARGAPAVAPRPRPRRARVDSPARQAIELDEHLLVGGGGLDDAGELRGGARDLAAARELAG